MPIVLFEDATCDYLAPITTGRLAATIFCGSYRLVDIIEMLGRRCYSVVRPYLRSLQQIDHRSLADFGSLLPSGLDERPKLLLNSRLVPSVSTLKTLKQLLDDPNPSPCVLWDRNSIAAVIAPGCSLASIAQLDYSQLHEFIQSFSNLPRSTLQLQTFEAPHEIVSRNIQILAENLELRIAKYEYRQTLDGVFMAEGAELGSYVLCESKSGPIVIDRNAKIGPYTLLRGPLYIGPKAKILEHAAIKDHVSLGHTTKIGGEVEASVVEPYTNKQHHGFLGHSYLGSWINLGAGTCNSDLKNTYGNVNMEYGFGKVNTGMQFVGCIMGDYSKSAINTGIFTGKVIGVCSMMYGFVTSNVPSFVNYARLFGQMATLPADVMIATQQRMFARRNVQQRDCDIQLIHDMFRLTQPERDRVGDSLV